MIFLLDNYDSFTYNLVQYLGELGAEVAVYRNDVMSAEDVLALAPEGIVLSPGPGRPENAGMMNELVAAAAGKVPVLGICLGHQAIAQTFGAKIDYAPCLMHGKTSEISHTGGALFEGIPSPFTATRYHSLIIDSSSLPTTFKVTARTDDNVIMSIEHEKMPLYGMQFHPESIMTPVGKDLLKNFMRTL